MFGGGNSRFGHSVASHMCNLDFSLVADVLNNQSIAAFFGAFSAFMLVVANDRYREKRKVKTLRAEIEVNLADAKAKRETCRQMRVMLLERNQIIPAPILRFNTNFSRQLAGDVLHHLSIDQRRSVEGLCYTMESIDELLTECFEISKKFDGPLDQSDRKKLSETLNINWSDSIANLNRLIEMCDQYLCGKYTGILVKKYDPAAYTEP